jgi:hypothetical protein
LRAASERHDLHSEHARIELAGDRNVRDGQDQVVDAIDVHAPPVVAHSAQRHPPSGSVAMYVRFVV